MQRPAMVGEPGRHGWRPEEPLPRRVVGSELAQAVVRPAEVVGGADQPHAGGEGRRRVGDRPPPAGQWHEVGAEGGVEPLDVGGVDDGAGGGRGQDRLDAVQGATHDPARDPDDVPLGGVLDDLGELEPVRQDQARTPAPPGADRLPEGFQEGGDVAGQAVDADQGSRGRRAGSDSLDQPGDQGQVPLTADHPTQPQPRWHRQGQGHPDLGANLFHPQLVRLDVLEVELPLFHQVLMHPLAVLPRTGEPARHRSLIEPERGDDRLRRAPMTQQREHQHRQLGRLVQPIERRADRLNERSAGSADTGTALPPGCGSRCSLHR